MPREIHLDQFGDSQDAIQAAVAELEAGRLVLTPDECGTCLLGLASQEQSAAEMAGFASEHPGAVASVAVAHPQVLHDYVPGAGRLLQKLSNRCWPGPVLLRAGAPQLEGLAREWPPAAHRWALNREGRVYSCPGETFTLEVLRSVSSPALCLTQVGDAATWKIEGSNSIGLTVHSPSSRFTETPTVVRVTEDKFEIERAGVASERMLARLAGEVYLFVCTGNTCRSPMAEAIFRKMLADRLRCREDELLDRGFVVVSAGLAAYRGGAAAPEAVQLLRQDGIDLSSHESQPVTEELLLHCDHIITMTRSHQDAVLSAFPELGGQVRLLSPTAQDISDPIGAGMEEYSRCRNEIASHLQHLLDEIDFSLE